MSERDPAVAADGGGAEAVSVAAPMETLLSRAGTGPLARWLPGREGLAFAAALARDPAPVARTLGGTAVELGRVLAGRSEIAPDRKDKRFADPAWTGNPVLRRVAQAYLAAAGAAERIVDGAELDWATDQRIRFLTENLVEALAPTNSPVLNPAAWKAAIDSGGANLARGAKALVTDLATAPRIPQMVEPDAKVPGRDLALTPGTVVFRNPVLELIQYAPQTDTVHSTPLLVVPPTINKYYVVDLAPGRSLVEHLVGAGQQVFSISWRNPRREDAGWGLDAYAVAVLEALDAVEEITGSPRTSLLALCSGGILTSMLVAHLAATGGQDRVAGLALLVTVLDQDQAGTTGALMDEGSAQAATQRSARQGYLDGAALAEVFAWLRPRDLVWNYWVNNYLLGKPPPAFDILSWNADTTRMTAALHRDFIDLAQGNKLTVPGAATLLATPVDLSRVEVDSYVVAGIADHLCPWQNCYSTTQLLGGSTRFVLSTSGHIAAIVNPPGNEKASFQVAEQHPADPEQWLDAAQEHRGSWWEDYSSWLAAHGGPKRPAPETPGGPAHPPLADAPGTYVFAR
ncbi:MAG: alpha/beta fold hydrolase [Pseudonocardiales bacterium]|nr:alpha/beta fold hydrolase [Pseudonocardiales bacterium]